MLHHPGAEPQPHTQPVLGHQHARHHQPHGDAGAQEVPQRELTHAREKVPAVIGWGRGVSSEPRATRLHHDRTTTRPHDHARTAAQPQGNNTTPPHHHTAPELHNYRPHGHTRTTTPPHRLTEVSGCMGHWTQRPHVGTSGSAHGPSCTNKGLQVGCAQRWLARVCVRL